MIDTGAIRKNVLRNAVSGKLVSQKKCDGNAKELLDRARTKTNSKKRFVIEDTPFEIPTEWEWCTITDISVSIGSQLGQIQSKDVKPCGKYPAISQGKIYIDGYCDDKEKVVNTLPVLLFGDHTKVVKYINMPFVICADGTKCMNVVEANPKYIFYWMQYASSQLDDRGYARHFSLLKKYPLPLPPLAEQQRIVERVESIFSLLDEIDEAQNSYEYDKQLLKNMLVDLGVTGKLTSTAETDIPFENELSKLSINDKIPLGNSICEIPSTWKWICLGNLGQNYKTSFADGPFGSNLKKEHYTDKKEVRIIQLSNVGEGGWKDENEKYTTNEHLKTIARSEVHAGDIVIAKMMPAGRAIIVPEKGYRFVLSSDNIRFEPNSILNSKYLYYAINSSVFKSQIDTHGIGRERTSLTKLKGYSIPIPPLAEQNRIVKRIEELLTLCF